MCLCTQASGVGPIVLFSTTLLVKLKDITDGDFPIAPRDGTILINLVTPFLAVISVTIYKYLGRRTILIIAHSFYVIAHTAVSLSMVYEEYILLFVLIVVFLACFQFLEGAMCFVYPAEVCVDTGMGFVLGGMFFMMILMSFTV